MTAPTSTKNDKKRKKKIENKAKLELQFLN